MSRVFFSSIGLFFSPVKIRPHVFFMLRELMRCMCTGLFFFAKVLCLFSLLFFFRFIFIVCYLLHSSVHNSVCVGMSRITNTLFKLFKNSRTLEKIVTLPCYSFGWLIASVSGTLFKYTLFGRLFCFFFANGCAENCVILFCTMYI